MAQPLKSDCPCERMLRVTEANNSLSDSLHQLAHECEKLRALQGDSRGIRRVYVKGYFAKNRIGRLIRWHTYAERTSHVSVIFPKPVDLGRMELYEVEADGKLGVIGHPHDKDARAGDYYYCDMTIEQYRAFVGIALSLVGKEYDRAGIKAFIFRSRRHDPDKWFCSELDGHCFRQVDLPLSRKPDYVLSPYDVITSIRLTPCSKEEVGV